jgi:diguanylate cyclase (GGDEF)-like protein
MALLFVIGGFTTLLLLALPHPTSLHVPTMVALGSVAPFVGFTVYRLRHRLPASAYPWLLATVTIIVTILVAAAGAYSAMVSFSFFYTWVVLYAVLFFSPLVVAVQVVLVAVCYGVAMTLYDNSEIDLLTPFEPMILVSVMATTGTVFAMLARARDASEIDSLTMVLNRRGIDRVLDDALTAGPEGREPLIVAMVDVDHFKSINDEQGHAAGDRVLTELAQAWRTVMRPGDFLGRMGGDEFLVGLPDCSRTDARKILERLRTAAPEGVTCSLGAASWQLGNSASMLVSNADAALYQAKNLGRNRVAWAGRAA